MGPFPGQLTNYKRIARYLTRLFIPKTRNKFK